MATEKYDWLYSGKKYKYLGTEKAEVIWNQQIKGRLKKEKTFGDLERFWNPNWMQRIKLQHLER
jgi:hypothetical protein